jgi:sulfur carrier protein
MIRVNGKEFEWETGMTVEKLLQQKKFTYPRIIVKINDKLIPEENYSKTFIYDESDVKVIHLLAGG